jgi:hypothetical protein
VKQVSSGIQDIKQLIKGGYLMKQEILSTTNRPSLEEVTNQFQNWRKTRKKRTAIPKELWQAAIDLSRDYPINIISKTLGLSYTDLKRRIKASGELRADNQNNVIPHFVEFDLSTAVSMECIVEMENPKGNRMKIHFKGCICSNLLELAKAFWGMRQ